MRLHHIAIWTFRLGELRNFYIRFLGGISNEKYINPKKGFKSYLISFDEGPTLELVSRVDVQNTPIEGNRRGPTHLTSTLPSREEILRFTEEMCSEEYTIAGEPRTSGDGYFESIILDPDGNRLEYVYKEKPGAERTEAALYPDIETKRLPLCPFQENDAEAFSACCQSPNLRNNAGWAPHKTLNESREILHNAFIGQEGIWAVTLKDTRQLIASIDIILDPEWENPQVRMLGYWLDGPYRGKGYISEAMQAVLNCGFNELQFSLITANCYPHSKRSQQALERNGFIYEDTLHQAKLTYNGNIYDHECYYIPNIARPTERNHDELIRLWEKSVRSMHHFLTEESIQFYKPLMHSHYLPAAALFIIRNSRGKIVAFMGLSDELIKVLFIHLDEQGERYGRRLIEYTICQEQIDKVDVNESNDRALRFYQHLRFEIIGRDKTDSMDKPYPILRLQLTDDKK